MEGSSWRVQIVHWDLKPDNDSSTYTLQIFNSLIVILQYSSNFDENKHGKTRGFWPVKSTRGDKFRERLCWGMSLPRSDFRIYSSMFERLHITCHLS